MPYQPVHFYQLLPAQAYSVFSRPRRAPQASYEIHFVKSTDPHYIPDDLEAWPLYHRCLLWGNVSVFEAFEPLAQDFHGL